MEYDIAYFSKFIKDSDKYWAHRPKAEDSNRLPELLSEHSALVYRYARNIAEKQHLQAIISNLINSSVPNDFPNKEFLINEVDILFWKSIAYHDLGKVNDRFQKKRMVNNTPMLKVYHPFDTHHAIISVYVFLFDAFSNICNAKISDKEYYYLCNVAMYLSYPMYKHHSPILDKTQTERNWDNEDLFYLKPYLSLFEIKTDDEKIEMFHSYFLNKANFNNNGGFFYLFNNEIQTKKCSFPLFSLVKLCYSLLTASDYLATAHYMNNWSEMLTDYNIIDENLSNKIIFNAENYKYNKSVYEAINKDNIPENALLQSKSNANLNELRKSIAIEVVKNVRKNIDKRLFYIEAPTGGGKTNVSMLALTELLRADKGKQINKVFYVFPFTTLVTQTCISLKHTLGLDDTELAEIHSKAPIKTTGNYEDDYLNYLDGLFMNYPITLLSHVKFFDILKTNDKETNYLLHRIANSVVIIDEIQSYPPNIWDEIIYLITNYAKYFKIRFILMSATLPKIGNLVDEESIKNDFVYLIKDKNIFFQNPNFCNRVGFDFSLYKIKLPIKEEKEDYLINLKNIVLEKSQDYAKNNLRHTNSVYTIIEFIFKKSASDFYSIISQCNDFFDEIFLLSGTILEPRRKEIINQLKSPELRLQKILLISTQVVEAGVDIDMDLGFKDQSIIDSEEQLAGRINRNADKSDCKLYVFNYDSSKTIYGKDQRFQIMKTLDVDYYQKVLKTKDFDNLYSKIINQIKQMDKSDFIENIHDFEKDISTLNFRNVDSDLKIIDSKNISVFVPLKINIEYLSNFKSILDGLKIEYDDFVDGKDVWKCYESLVGKKDEDFTKNKIQMKEIQSFMSNFIFSVFPNGKDYDNLKTYGKEEYGFLYLETFSKIYSFEYGINASAFKDSNFL